MPVTAIADIINPEVLADQIEAKFPDELVLGRTNLVEVNADFPLGTPGTQFKMPFWKRINGFGALTEGTAMTTNKVAADAEYAIVQRAGNAYEVYDTAQLVTSADPVGEIARQIARRAAEYVDASLVTKMDNTPNSTDISGTGAGTMTVDGLITALITALGDNYSKLISNGALIMHSKVYGDLLKLGVIQNQYQSGMDVLRSGNIPTLLGLPILLSDRVTSAVVSSVTYYNTYVVGPGSLALFYQRGVQVEFDRDILKSSDVIAATVHFATHLHGYDDATSAVKVEDNKSITVVKVKSK